MKKLIALVGTATVFVACDAANAVVPDIGDAVTTAVNRLVGAKLFVNPGSRAERQANEWRTTRPSDAALMDRMAAQPVASWMNGWSGDVRQAVANVVSRAASRGGTPVFVAYNIPFRDCGSYSAGGTANAGAYRKWIREFAGGLKGTAVVVLEPDAIPGASCLPAAGQTERFALLTDAVQVLKAAGAVVYLDAGHPKWLSPDEAARRLALAGIAEADGFALNVSNYQTTSANIAYGDALSKRVGGKHYVIDTSRNGVGGAGSEWCNVAGQALGANPTTNTGHPLVDAFLWIKVPGESDGTCNGGPKSGAWWPDYALGLAQNALTLASR